MCSAALLVFFRKRASSRVLSGRCRFLGDGRSGTKASFFPRLSHVGATLFGVLLVLFASSWRLQAALTISSGTTLSSLDFSTQDISISSGTSAISVTVNGDIIGASGYTLSISNATVTQGSVSSYKFAAAYTAVASTGAVTIGNNGYLNIGNAGALTFIGGGSSGNARGTGVLTLNGGQVTVGAAGASSPNDALYLGGYGGAGTIYLDGGVLSSSRLITKGSGSGVMYFNGGKLQAGSSLSGTSLINSSVTLYVSSGGALVDTNGMNVSIDSALLANPNSTGGGLTKSGVGTLTLSAADTYTGAVVVSAGTLQVQGVAFSTTARTYTIASGAVLNIAGNTGVATGTSVIGGDGTLRISGGYFSNESPNTAIGPSRYVNINLNYGAIIDVLSGGYMRNGGWADLIWTNNHAVLNVNGTFDLWDGNTVYTPALTGSGSVLIGDGASRTLQVGEDSGSGTFTGGIANSITIEKIGSGTQVFAGASTYSGTTTVTGGALNIQNATALGSTAGATTVSSGAALQIQGGIAVGAEGLTLNGSGVSSDGALRNISDTNSYSGAITLGSASRINSDSGLLTLSGGVTGAYALTIGGGGNLAFSGVMALSTGGLTKDGGGTATLSGSNTYSGVTTVNGGNLKLTDNAVLALKNSVVVNSGASFEVSLSNALTVVKSFTISGAGTVVKSGAGKWTVGANGLHVSFNLSSGGLIDIQAGVVQADYNGTSFGSNQGSVNVASGATLDFYAENAQMDALNGAGILQNSYTGGSHNVTLGVAGSSGSFSGVIKDGNSTALVLTKSGSGTQVLSGTNTYTGTTTISAGSLVLGAGGTTGALSTSSALVDNAMIGFNRSNTITQGSDFASLISGSGGLVQFGSGTLVLNMVNTYTGGTTVAAGSLLFRGGSNRLATSGSITGAGGVLDLGGYSQTSSGVISLTGGTFQNGTLTATANAFDMQSGSVSAVLSGTQGLTKTTTGWVTLSNSNTYSGGTTVSAGSLLLSGGSNRLSTSGAVSVAGGVLDLGGYNQSTSGLITISGGIVQNGLLTSTVSAYELQSGSVSAVLAGAVGLNKTTSGSGYLSGANTYVGATTIYAGSLILGIGGTTGSLSPSSALVDNGTLGFYRSDSITQGSDFAAVISGSGSVVQFGSGTLVLSGVNTYTGGTTIVAGSLVLSGGSNRLSLSGSITSAGGVLDISGLSQSTSGSIIFAGGTVQNGTLTATASPYDARSGMVSALLTGTQALLKTTTDSLTLTNSNTYTGGTTVSAGSLLLSGGNNRLASSGSISGAGGVFDLGGYSQLSAGVISLTGGMFQNGTLTATANAFDMQSGSVSAVLAGTQALNKTTTGSVTLSGANTYVGATTVSEGTLQLGIGGTVGSLSSASALSVGSGAVLSFNRSNSATQGTDFATLISGSGTVMQIGSGTLVLSGGNTYSGGTKLNAGSLFVNSAYALGTGTLTISASTTLGNTSGSAVTLANNNAQVWAGNFGFAGGSDLNLGTGAVTLMASPLVTVSTGTLTVGGTISGSFGLTTAGTGLLVLSGMNIYSGMTTVTAGTLQVGAGSTSGRLGTGAVSVASAAVLTFNRSNAATQGSDFGVISGAGTVMQIGSGTLILSGSNTYGGGTSLKAGSLFVNSAYALGSGSLTISASTTLGNTSGAALTLATNNTQVWAGSFGFAGSNDLNLGTGSVTLTASPVVTVSAGTLTEGGSISGAFGLSKAGSGALVLSAANVFTGATSVSAGTLQLGAGATTGSLLSTGSLSVASGAVLAFNRSNTVTQGTDFGTAISGAGALMQLGSGTLVLSGTNTYSGGTTLNSGSLFVNSAYALGTGSLSIAASTTVANMSGSSFTLANNNAQVWAGSFTFAGGSDLNFGTGAVTLTASPVVTVSAGTLTEGGVISGAYSLTKAGSGVLTLTGANTFSGGLTLSAGTLNVNNSKALGAAASVLTISGGSIDNASGAALTLSNNNAQTWSGDFVF